MDQREMTASTALSVVIVAAVAIFLREPDVGRDTLKLTRAEAIGLPAVDHKNALETGLMAPVTTRVADRDPPPRSAAFAPESNPGTSQTLAQVDGPGDRPIREQVAVVSRRPTIKPTQARGAFTTVVAGESLADVALRIYGDESARERLWTANRDELPRRDSQLKAGTLLRTP